MKNIFQLLIFGMALSTACMTFGQENAEERAVNKIQKNHISIEEFPTNKPINFIEGWGGMSIAINEMPAGTDLGPLLMGLKNNSCQVPHWGYLIKGVVRLKYDDGREEVLKAGDVFYMPPGHVAVVEEDAKMMDFSPEKGFKKVVSHIEMKIDEASKQ